MRIYRLYVQSQQSFQSSRRYKSKFENNENVFMTGFILVNATLETSTLRLNPRPQYPHQPHKYHQTFHFPCADLQNDRNILLKPSIAQWETHSSQSLLSFISIYFDPTGAGNKAPPAQIPSRLYRFYWFCCGFSRGNFLAAPVSYSHLKGVKVKVELIEDRNVQCLLRNSLWESYCRKCGYRVCERCRKVAQREVDEGRGEESVLG